MDALPIVHRGGLHDVAPCGRACSWFVCVKLMCTVPPVAAELPTGTAATAPPSGHAPPAAVVQGTGPGSCVGTAPQGTTQAWGRPSACTRGSVARTSLWYVGCVLETSRDCREVSKLTDRVHTVDVRLCCMDCKLVHQASSTPPPLLIAHTP